MISLSRRRLGEGLLLAFDGRFAAFLPEWSRLIFLNDPASPHTMSQAEAEKLCLETLSACANGKPRHRNAQAVRNYWHQPRHLISALNLNLTDRCNLACTYCYARGGNYLRLRQQFEPAAAVQAVADAFAHADPTRDFRIEFFGGEPFLNAEAVSAVLDWQEQNTDWTRRQAGTNNRVSTNLTELSESMLNDIRRSRMILSVSIDGIGQIQDEQRPFKDGTGSSRIIFEHLRRVREACPKHTIVARMTAWRHAGSLRQTLEELVATGIFDYASIYPAAVHTDDTRDVGDSYFSTDFQREYLQIAADYPSLLGRGRFKGVLELNRYLQLMFEGKAVASHCRAGAGYFTCSPDGSLHPCHRLVGDIGWNLDRFDLGFPYLQEKLAPWRVSVLDRETCSACPIRYLCGGGCRQENLLASGDLNGVSPRVCAFSHLLFDAAVLVAMRLTPQIMPMLRKAFAQSESLFVLCGQPLVANERPGFATLVPSLPATHFPERMLHP